jgi:FXSXX-COOH protein
MPQPGNPQCDEDVELAIADLRRSPLDGVLGAGDSVLDMALNQVLDRMRRSPEDYATHGSTPAP